VAVAAVIDQTGRTEDRAAVPMQTAAPYELAVVPLRTTRTAPRDMVTLVIQLRGFMLALAEEVLAWEEAAATGATGGSLIYQVRTPTMRAAAGRDTAALVAVDLVAAARPPPAVMAILAMRIPGEAVLAGEITTGRVVQAVAESSLSATWRKETHDALHRRNKYSHQFCGTEIYSSADW